MRTPTTFAELVSFLIETLSLVIPLIFGLTLLFIIWKIVDSWIISGGDATKISEGKQYALIGIIALVIMSSIWGILQILRHSLFGL
ncbi:hypothetical protein KC722_01465 [Candidatus Kaiserbacteria bacterium]|nr:hypothetical protein [Candidatus Kaiserbacteria bacterium]